MDELNTRFITHIVTDVMTDVTDIVSDTMSGYRRLGLIKRAVIFA